MKTESRFCELRLEASPEGSPEGSGPGRLIGTLLTYGERAADRQEVFQPGSLHWPDSGGVVLREMHNRQAPIIRFQPKVEGRQVRADVALPDTQRGRDAAVMVRNGTLKGLSVEFIAEEESQVAGVREIRKARLVGAGLVDSPSYSGSSVAVRSTSAPAPRYYV